MILNFNKNQTKHTNFHGEVVFAGTLLVLLSRPMIQRAVGTGDEDLLLENTQLKQCQDQYVLNNVKLLEFVVTLK